MKSTIDLNYYFNSLLETGIKKSEAGRLTMGDFDRSDPDGASVLIKHKARNVYKERRIDVTSNIDCAA